MCAYMYIFLTVYSTKLVFPVTYRGEKNLQYCTSKFSRLAIRFYCVVAVCSKGILLQIGHRVHMYGHISFGGFL